MASVSMSLAPGGLFFGTIPNFSVIRRKMRAVSDDCHRIQNGIFSLELDEGVQLIPDYGKRYYFELSEAIERCPEYFIPFPMLESLAEEHGMEACLELPFKQFFERYSERHMDLLIRMNIVDAYGNMRLSPDELEVAELYMAFCFRKKKSSYK
jgi:mRNA (guanine-N7-)-methyltransferase